MYHNNMEGRGVSNPNEAFDPHLPGLQYGVLDELTGYALRRAQLLITQAFDAAFGPEGITTQRVSALTLIALNPGMSQTRLAHAIGASRPQITVVVDALLELGLVERRPAPTDRRSVSLHLTAQGAETFPRLATRVRAHDARQTLALTPTQIDDLRRLLGGLGAGPANPTGAAHG